jgi:signal transduction histidine kinase
LDDGTLPEALEQLAAQITKDAKLVCQFTQRGTARTLSTEVQDELFRIAQEAMTNVRKHAHAKSARINLESKLNRVILTVEDNGIGMSKNNPHTIKRGYGLASMRERAQHIGGRLEIDTHPGRGTKICVSVPLRTRTEPTARIT